MFLFTIFGRFLPNRRRHTESSKANVESVGGNWENLAEPGRVLTSISEILHYLLDLAIFRFFYFDL